MTGQKSTRTFRDLTLDTVLPCHSLVSPCSRLAYCCSWRIKLCFHIYLNRLTPLVSLEVGMCERRNCRRKEWCRSSIVTSKDTVHQTSRAAAAPVRRTVEVMGSERESDVRLISQGAAAHQSFLMTVTLTVPKHFWRDITLPWRCRILSPKLQALLTVKLANNRFCCCVAYPT